MTINRILLLTIILIVILTIGMLATRMLQGVNTATATVERVLTETSMTRTAMP